MSSCGAAAAAARARERRVRPRPTRARGATATAARRLRRGTRSARPGSPVAAGAVSTGGCDVERRAGPRRRSRGAAGRAPIPCSVISLSRAAGAARDRGGNRGTTASSAARRRRPLPSGRPARGTRRSRPRATRGPSDRSRRSRAAGARAASAAAGPRTSSRAPGARRADSCQTWLWQFMQTAVGGTPAYFDRVRLVVAIEAVDAVVAHVMAVVERDRLIDRVVLPGDVRRSYPEHHRDGSPDDGRDRDEQADAEDRVGPGREERGHARRRPMCNPCAGRAVRG